MGNAGEKGGLFSAKGVAFRREESFLIPAEKPRGGTKEGKVFAPSAQFFVGFGKRGHGGMMKQQKALWNVFLARLVESVFQTDRAQGWSDLFEGGCRKETAGDQFLGEFDLTGGKSDGGGFGEGAVEQFVIEKLMRDLGKAFGRKDGDREGEAIVGVVVRFGNGRGKALPQFYKAGEVENSEMTGCVIIEKEDFGHGGVGGGGFVVAATGDFLKNLFYISARHIGLSQPIQGEE
jgi:hypothetical protein